jgi:hypothetical protein
MASTSGFINPISQAATHNLTSPLPTNIFAQPYVLPLAAPPSPVPFSPSTQELLREFVNLPTPVFERTHDFGQVNQRSANDREDSDMNNIGLAGSTESFLVLPGDVATTLEENDYPAPMMFPSGFNLWDMSGFDHNGADWEAFQALAPPVNQPDLGPSSHANLYLNVDPITPMEQEPERIVFPTTSPGSSQISPELSELTLPWSPPMSKMEERKIIDVPPFLRQKLVQSYCFNIKRFATFHVDRLKFRDRLLRGLESDLHPAFVFSSVGILSDRQPRR